MAKTFAQTGGLLGLTLSILTVSILVNLYPSLAVFFFIFIFLGIYMFYKSMKLELLQNLELFLIGIASLLLGVTGVFGDATVGPVPLKMAGIVILIIVLTFLLLMFVYHYGKKVWVFGGK